MPNKDNKTEEVSKQDWKDPRILAVNKTEEKKHTDGICQACRPNFEDDLKGGGADEVKDTSLEDWEGKLNTILWANLDITEPPTGTLRPMRKELQDDLISFISEVRQATEKKVRGEIVKKIKEKGLHLGYANDIIKTITDK